MILNPRYFVLPSDEGARENNVRGINITVSRLIHSFLKWKSFNCRKRSKSSHPALLYDFKFPNFVVKSLAQKSFFANWKNRQCHPFRTCVSLERRISARKQQNTPRKVCIGLKWWVLIIPRRVPAPIDRNLRQNHWYLQISWFTSEFWPRGKIWKVFQFKIHQCEQVK